MCLAMHSLTMLSSAQKHKQSSLSQELEDGEAAHARALEMYRLTPTAPELDQLLRLSYKFRRLVIKYMHPPFLHHREACT